jgi:regulator of sirC expression with transglutaminase-like and TPR domain
MINVQSLNALIELIDDPDESVYLHVRDQLKMCGSTAIPYLESSWEKKNFGLVFQHRIEDLIQEIQFESIKTSLKIWINSVHKDLLEGALLIAKFQYPDLDEQKIHRDLEQIKRDIWLELSPNQTAFEKVKTFNKVFFDIHKFKGNSRNFHSPLNSYINTVLETRKGNPLSLSIIYSIVAQNLSIPIFGVNLPNHFVLAYMDTNKVNYENGIHNPYGVLFYINPFSKGSILRELDIHTFLADLNLEASREFLEPCSNSIILQRMITNLIASFQQVGNLEKVTKLIELRSLFLK